MRRGGTRNNRLLSISLALRTTQPGLSEVGSSPGLSLSPPHQLTPSTSGRDAFHRVPNFPSGRMSVSGRSGEAMRRRTVRRPTSSGGRMGRGLVWDDVEVVPTQLANPRSSAPFMAPGHSTYYSQTTHDPSILALANPRRFPYPRLHHELAFCSTGIAVDGRRRFNRGWLRRLLRASSTRRRVATTGPAKPAHR